MNHQQALTKYIASFVAELIHAGVKDVVVSPGSRSTPIAMIMAEHPDLRLHIHVDERSAAFFALGMAKASRNPTVLLCTSGTAAANYFPAIAEANLSRVPLIVVTADRPHELRDVGAPQAMDQVNLYGKHVKWFVEMSHPEGSIEMLRYTRTVASRAVATALSSPAGPVHLNFPLREPLVPDLTSETLFVMAERENGYVHIEQGHLSLNAHQLHLIADELNKCTNGLIVCGEMESPAFAEAVTKLAEKLQYPIIADPLSQLRSGKHKFVHIIDSYDTFLRNEDAVNHLTPDVIIRFGAMPISKAFSLFMKKNEQATQYVIDGGEGWRDPSLLTFNMIYCDEVQFCDSLLPLLNENQDTLFVEKWQQINEITKAALFRIKENESLSEGRLFNELVELLPDGATLFVGNSMPIRDVDTFFYNNAKSIRIMANRGANGIDGIISSALGAGTVHKPMYLVLGDLTFFHDLNGLIASKLYNIDLRVIVINNNGGGIFSFLPQASHPKHFERLFGTPLDLDFEPAVSMYGGTFSRVSSWLEFTSSFEQNLAINGLSVIEIPTKRAENLQEHRNLWDYVSREISRNLPGEC
ncbi:2-succinyl-5-enolpyruvyl-6-hydroxy-3-cyclohexene-1-carboxylic-acid synthase [Robertmurraya korlensis]|uniref:2-succinyl-5-enolpyruvyl-6-hydroxy-3- cyclohexene-1-carboxylic-acid synthase n=1 Tax=Robertmurraya korlensis TaxID=519977 RepID=UPI00082629A1|nr:2-succinyl-5-enolpyruvyl-6-hydroxy-3-cyclohexene-1-carboxylic-acid synthase [Robertmurraya korlensis]